MLYDNNKSRVTKRNQCIYGSLKQRIPKCRGRFRAFWK